MISRFVPAEQLGGSARSFATAYADLHGQPPPVAVYAADAAEAVLAAAGSGNGVALAGRDGARARCPPTTRCSAAGRRRPTGGITPRPLAVLVVDGGAFRVERVVSVSDPLPPSGEVK